MKSTWSHKMRALDLFCGGGGACLGMQAAGFSVVGIDIECQPAYPGTFVQANALLPPVDLAAFDFVWASPPCEIFSSARNGHRTKPTRWGDLIDPVRRLLESHPYTCIENIPLAPIRPDVILTGPACGLPRIRWVRHFELSFFALYPNPVIPPRSLSRDGFLITPTRGGASNHQIRMRRNAGLSSVPNLAEKKTAKGIPDKVMMTHHQVGGAVPPPYAEFIATQARIATQKETP